MATNFRLNAMRCSLEVSIMMNARDQKIVDQRRGDRRRANVESAFDGPERRKAERRRRPSDERPDDIAGSSEMREQR
jgi:hypothetical protein